MARADRCVGARAKRTRISWSLFLLGSQHHDGINWHLKLAHIAQMLLRICTPTKVEETVIVLISVVARGEEGKLPPETPENLQRIGNNPGLSQQ